MMQQFNDYAPFELEGNAGATETDKREPFVATAFTCPECGEWFSRVQALRTEQHVRIRCPECGAVTRFGDRTGIERGEAK